MKSLFDEPRRFMSREECEALTKRIFAMCPEGETFVSIQSSWRANIRWGRNRVNTGGDTQTTNISISRNIRGAGGSASTNALDDAALKACIERAEELALFGSENPDQYPDTPEKVLPHLNPQLWFDSTYNLDAEARGIAAASLITPAEEAKLLSAGYVEVAGLGYCVANTSGVFRYYPYTTAQYSVTVRNPTGTGSGWAGVDFNDWTRIDAPKLSAIALDKCVRSADPVAVEPGRYEAILEPQAVCDLFAPILDRAMGRVPAENMQGPFADSPGQSKIGQQLLDNRITISADPMDPDGGFVPFDGSGEPFKPVKWFENGVLKELAYSRSYARTQLGIDEALPNSRMFRMSGGTTTIEEMIADCERGILVTRFNSLNLIDFRSMLMGGNTRDGLWLIERGKITKTIKNFRITESPLFAFNNVEQLGVPQRVFRPGAPAIVPPARVKDFAFTGLMDAV